MEVLYSCLQISFDIILEVEKLPQIGFPGH